MTRAGRAVLAGALVALAAGTGVVLPAAPAAAEDVSCLSVTPDTEEVPSSDTPSQPLLDLGVPAAWRAVAERGAPPPGDGVTVAVLDSGISPRAGLPLLEGGGQVIDPHGTVVAGIIAAAARDKVAGGDSLGPDVGPGAGVVGVAPGVRLLDVRVYDTAGPSQPDQRPPTSAGLAAGLREVLDAVRDGRSVDLVNVSVQVPRTREVDELVARLVEEGVVVVAQAGDVPSDGDPVADELGEVSLGTDAAAVVAPAGSDPGVVAVGVAPTETDPDPDGLPSSAMDVVAPALGLVSVSVLGGHCVVDSTSTSFSTAVVTGLLAVLRSTYPDDSPADLVDRLLLSAGGRPDVRSPRTGAGPVQPLAAVTRPLEPMRDGSPGQTEPRGVAGAARAPVADDDLLARTRGSAVWWGLAGGGALLLALVLRPVLARRT